MTLTTYVAEPSSGMNANSVCTWMRRDDVLEWRCTREQKKKEAYPSLLEETRSTPMRRWETPIRLRSRLQERDCPPHHQLNLSCHKKRKTQERTMNNKNHCIPSRQPRKTQKVDMVLGKRHHWLIRGRRLACRKIRFLDVHPWDSS